MKTVGMNKAGNGTAAGMAAFLLLAMIGAGLAGNSWAGNNGGQAFTLWPDTGQTKCFNNLDEEISCPAKGQAFHGQDAQYQGLMRSYTDLGDGTVRDNITGLVWEQKHNLDNVKAYNDPHDADNSYTWCDTNPVTNGNNQGTCGDHDTQDFLDQLNSAGFAGHSDWRLPTVKELATLKDYGRVNQSIDPVFAAGIQKGLPYWSSTTTVDQNTYVYMSTFNNFGDGVGEKNRDYNVLAVRGELVPGSVQTAYVDNGDGTITDTLTGLQWQKGAIDVDGDGNPDQLTWPEALAAAENLTLAGHGDWRLPNVNELRSLVDYSRLEPAIDPVFAATTQWWSPYWSSTTLAYYGGQAWLVRFQTGNFSFGVKDTEHYFVQAVRDNHGAGEDFPLHIFLPAILQKP